MKTTIHRLVITMILTAGVITTTRAQSAIEDVPKRFFTEFVKDPSAAVDNVFATNKWINRNMDAVVKMRGQLKGLVEICGDYYGYDKIIERSAGERTKILIYIARYERQPIRFMFIMYKPKDTWQVQNFAFDSDVDDDLKEAAKMELIKGRKE